MSAATHTCTCGAHLVVDDCKYLGPQELGEGEIALLFNCPHCSTTFSGQVLQDAAICSDCRHAIVGDAEDPKTVGTIDTTEGVESRTWCFDCAQAYVNRFAVRRAA